MIMASFQINRALILLLLLHFHSRVDADVAFEPGILPRRHLLQTKKPCPVDFEHQNYTIIVSECKRPDYEPKPCCASLLKFACPYAAALNDLSNDCAEIMFSYIRRIGQYPDGLFSSICRGGRDGLECPLIPPPPSSGGGRRSRACGLWTKVFILTVSMMFVA